MISHIPIRARTALLVAIVAMVAAISIGLLTMVASEHDRRIEFDGRLSEEAGEVFQFLAREGSLNAFLASEPRSGNVQRVALVSPAGEVVAGSDPQPPMPDAGPMTNTFVTVHGEEADWREVALPLSSRPDAPTIVVAMSTVRMQREIAAARLSTVRVMVLAVSVLSLAGWILADRIIRPIEDLRRSALVLAGDPLGRRLRLPVANDEVRLLGETFNATLDHIDESVRVQRKFIAQASHELRTPIARLMATVDLARRPVRSDAEVRDALADIERHVRHLSTLSDSMLELLTSTERSRPVAQYSIGRILGGLAANSEFAEIEVEVEQSTLGVTFPCEPALVIGAVSNLVGNALRHGEPPVTVAVSVSGGAVEFSVSDRGQGIAHDQMEDMLRPFERGSASSDTPGAGLGMSIVSGTMDLHGGSLSMRQSAGGFAVVLRFPVEDDGAI